ncbi:LOW QUALITY PROTEIN: hypothetical protein Cgig2_010418 [Carnegiea gigantea]|uniref:Uncharacterized protein n=1 Tax=Carnegiea gigantea TaxID=171969 RepID=A0A9Q1JGN5_9CARY|nr:LOW QUALITY PROTEIN: hypothetical protein Cgig2_010418 [Carnegiea gigantea]
MVDNERKGVGDVVLRHRRALEAVCTLNSELADCQKIAIERTSLVLRYKPFVLERHLVRALVECCVSKTKSFRIARRHVPFLVYDVALLMGLPATRKHVTFDEGQGECEVQEVWFYEHTNLYVHADGKRVPRIGCWVNLYIGRKYNVTELISSIKDNQIVPILEVRELERREAIVKAFIDTDDAHDEGGTVESEKGTEAGDKGTLHLRALLLGRGWGDDVPQGMHIKGPDLAHGVEGSSDASDTRIATSMGGDSHVLHANLYATDVGSTQDIEALEGNLVPTLECGIQAANDVGQEEEMHTTCEGSKPSIAKRI